MSKYKVFWIDDEAFDKDWKDFIETWKEDWNIELVPCKDAGGLKEFDAHIFEWSAIIFDALDEEMSLKTTRICRDHILQHNRDIPMFMFSGKTKVLGDETLVMDSFGFSRIYKKGKDSEQLAQDIIKAAENLIETKMKTIHAERIALCNEFANEIIEIATAIEKRQFTQTNFFNSMRDILEWVVTYGKQHGAFAPCVITPANASTFIPMIKNNEIVPSYFVPIFAACNEIVQNGSHSKFAGPNIKVKEAVKNGDAPGLITSAFNNLMAILDWCKTMPTKSEEIENWRKHTDQIKLVQDPLVGVVQQDEKGNYFCVDENDANRACTIGYLYAQEQNLLGKRVNINNMIGNKNYPAQSPYPFYTTKNITIL